MTHIVDFEKDFAPLYGSYIFMPDKEQDKVAVDLMAAANKAGRKWKKQVKIGGIEARHPQNAVHDWA